MLDSIARFSTFELVLFGCCGITLVVFLGAAFFLRHYQLHLSIRYVRARFSTLPALLAVTLGVAVIAVALGIMSGYLERVRETIRGQESHLLVTSGERYGITNVARVERSLRAVKNVAATAPYVETLAMYRSFGHFEPCRIRGIDVPDYLEVSSMGRYILRKSELDAFLNATGLAMDGKARESKPSKDRIDVRRYIESILNAPERTPLSAAEFREIFSPEFRRRLLSEQGLLELYAGVPPQAVLVGAQMLAERKMYVGQVINVVTGEPGTNSPVDLELVVAGTFKTGDFKTDSGLLLTHVDTLKDRLDLFDLQSNSFRYEGIHVALITEKLLDSTRDRVQKLLRAKYRRYGVLTWEELKPNELQAVKIERRVIYFLLIFVVAFTACMLLVMLVLTVIEKTSDIGVLVALGATRFGVLWIFLMKGLFITMAGTALGMLCGYYFCKHVNTIHDWVYAQTGLQLFPAEIYNLDSVPISFQAGDILRCIAPPIVLGFLASLIPAIWAARRDPIKSIRQE